MFDPAVEVLSVVGRMGGCDIGLWDPTALVSHRVLVASDCLVSTTEENNWLIPLLNLVLPH